MGKDRMKLTRNEKMALSLNPENDYRTFTPGMSDNDIDEKLERETAMKAEAEFDAFKEQVEKNYAAVKKSQDELGYDVDTADIRPMFTRLLVKPFDKNPFQKVIRSEKTPGLITDVGGYSPHVQFNSVTGKYEEQDQFIRCGLVTEVGPDVKWLQEGDVVYYRKDTVVPVPFMHWGLVSLAENLVIAAVNMNLSKRWEKLIETNSK